MSSLRNTSLPARVAFREKTSVRQIQTCKHIYILIISWSELIFGWGEVTGGEMTIGAKWPDTVLTNENSTRACFLRCKLCCVYPTGLGWYSLGSCTFNMAAMFTSTIKIVCYLRVVFVLSQRNTLKHKTITSNVVVGLRNGHVHVFTRSLQSKATNVSLGLVMYFKKQTFFLLQEIITL